MQPLLALASTLIFATSAVAQPAVPARQIDRQPELPELSQTGAPNPLTGLPGEMFERMSFETARNHDKQRNRLFMVFIPCSLPGADPNSSFLRCRRSQTLHAFIKWHATAIVTSDIPDWLRREIRRKIEASGRQIGGGYPVVAILRDRQIEKIILNYAVLRPTTEDVLPQGWLSEKGLSDEDRARGRPDNAMGPVEVLLQADLTLDAIRARDPIWWEAHNADNPSPPPPHEPLPLCFADSTALQRVDDPRPDDADLLTPVARLAHARALLKSGESRGAAGYYAWLWERAEVLDPSFRPARLSILPGELKSLRDATPACRQLVGELKNRRALQHPWADFSRWADMYAINSADDDPVATLGDMDRAMNSQADSPMLPSADSMVYFTLAQRSDYADARELPARPAEHLARIAALPSRLPSSAAPDVRSQMKAFVADHLRNESCRLYAALLSRNRDAEAFDIASWLLDRDDTALARAALVTTALAIHPPQPREHQRAWAAQAALDARFARAVSELDKAMPAVREHPPR